MHPCTHSNAALTGCGVGLGHHTLRLAHAHASRAALHRHTHTYMACSRTGSVGAGLCAQVTQNDEGARGCLVASGRGGQMSWQCIALASAQPHPDAIASTGQSMSTTKRPQASPNLRRPRHAAAEDGCQLTHKGPIRRRARHLHASQRLPFASQRPASPSKHQQ